MPLNKLEILLAGGSGGLGSATSSLLQSEGAQVHIASRSAGIHFDITSRADRARVLSAVPLIHGLVVFTGTPARASAGISTEETMRLSHEINYQGPILLARAAAEQMKQNGIPGSIVLLSTMQAVALFPGSTIYAGAKAALQHSALILAKECRAANIRVNVIAPGITAAGMAQASIASGKYNRYISDGIIPRFGHALDVARAVRLFLEPDNYITGQILSVDGGITL